MARSQLDILIDASWQGNRAVRQAEGDLRDLDKTTRAAGESSGNFGNILAGLAGGALVALSDRLIDAAFAAREYAQESILLAQSAEETTSLLQFSLGPAYDSFIERLDETSEATGRSRAALEEQSSTFIAMTKTAGFAADEAADISASLANIALDLGSFFNQDSEQVFGDLQSALAGSSETLQKYGIDVRDTALRAAALEAGIIEANRPLSQQERILAILSEVQRQAADAMGDAERTADGAANKSRALEDAYRDLQQAIGQELLPVQERLIDNQLRLIDAFGEDGVRAVGEIANAFEDVLIVLSNIDRLYNDNSFLGTYIDLVQRGIELRGGLLNSLTTPATGGFINSQLQFFNVNAERIRQEEAQAKQLRETREIQELYNSSLDTGTVKIAAVTEETQRAYSSQRDYLRVIREQTDAGQAYFDSLEEKRRLEEAQAAVAERAAEAQRQLGGAFLESLETINSLETPEDPLGLESFQSVADLSIPDLLFRIGKEAGLAAPQLGALASATGEFSREQINAALLAAAFDVKIGQIADRLASDYSYTLEEAERDLISWREEILNTEDPLLNLNTVTKSAADVLREDLVGGMILTRDGAIDTKADVDLLLESLDKIEGSRQATVNVQINGLEDLERAVQLAERIGAGRLLTPDDPLVQKALNGRTVRQLPSSVDDVNSQGAYR